MTESGDIAKGSKSRFLSKSKWGKVFRERQPHEQPSNPAHTDSFKLNEDVTDFLKPSTDRAAAIRPKLDVSISQRWPHAHEVRAAAEGASPFGSVDVNGYTKPARRKGLAVSFIGTPPETIGEGGDESQEPVAEIGRRKALLRRSASERAQGVSGTQRTQGYEEPTAPQDGEDRNFQPPVLRSAESSHHELPTTIQRKPFNTSTDDKPTAIPDPFNRDLPRTETSTGDTPTQQLNNPLDERRRSMRMSEGLAFRRASALITPDGLNTISHDFARGMQPSPKLYDELSRPDAPIPAPDAVGTLRPDSSHSNLSSTFSGQVPPRRPLPYSFNDSQHSIHLSPNESNPSLREQVEEKSIFTRPNGSNTSVGQNNPSPRPAISLSPSRDDDSSPPPHFPVPTPRQPLDVTPSSALSNRNRSPQSAVQGGLYQSYHLSQENVVGRAGDSIDNLSPYNGSYNRAGTRQISESSQLYHNVTIPRISSDSSMHKAGNEHAKQSNAGSNSVGLFEEQNAPSHSASVTTSRLATTTPGNDSLSHGPQPGQRGRSTSPLPPRNTDPMLDAAMKDFTTRVMHMSGVFSLTAEKERSLNNTTSEAWLRAAIWWYLKSKIGADDLIRQRKAASRPMQDLLLQPHVDLAKVCWILADRLNYPELVPKDQSPDAPRGRLPAGPNLQLISALSAYTKSLCLTLGRNHLMPPRQSLIQGQDTTIWQGYPPFTTEAAAVLAGNLVPKADDNISRQSSHPPIFESLPLGDAMHTFCNGRFLVEVAVSTDDPTTDRLPFQCMLSMLRNRSAYRPRVVISSQSELVYIQIEAPEDRASRTVAWHEVSWNRDRATLNVRLPYGYKVSVAMHEPDFRTLWQFYETARHVEHALSHQEDERLAFQTAVPELQYAESSGMTSFPRDKVRECRVTVFERSKNIVSGGKGRQIHVGLRLLLTTDPGQKQLGCAAHFIGQGTPLLIEFKTDAAAHGMVAMVIRLNEESRQCRILLVFADDKSRRALYDVLCGLALRPREDIVDQAALAALNITRATEFTDMRHLDRSALASLRWQKIIVVDECENLEEHKGTERSPSSNMRIVAQASHGCITDRVNMGTGELLFRLSLDEIPEICMFRNAQPDLSMSLDSAQLHSSDVEEATSLLRIAQRQPTIRTWTFRSLDDLHSFQLALTGFHVRYDGLASTFSISRRRMMVPMHKKLAATQVRMQIVSRGAVFHVIAFMEHFSLADALCFQVKTTDVFEQVKGNGKDKKPAIKLVDAKFYLPPSNVEKNETDGSEDQGVEERVRRRFVNLDVLDYAEEHDDIIVEFDTDKERDLFAQALPAATTLSKGLTLKRRI